MKTEEQRLKFNAYMKAWYAKNKERVKKSSAAAYLRKKERNPNLAKERYAQEKAYLAANPHKKERYKEAQKRFRAKWGSDYHHNLYLKDTYGISIEQYKAMLEAQNYRCKLCRKHQSEQKNRLHVDHCHVTGRIRGILCAPCNSGLGLAKESSELYLKAADYLAYWNQDILDRKAQGVLPEYPKNRKPSKAKTAASQSARKLRTKRIAPEEISHDVLMEISKKVLAETAA